MYPSQERKFYTTSLLQRTRVTVTEERVIVTEDSFIVTERRFIFLFIALCWMQNHKTGAPGKLLAQFLGAP